MSSEPESTENAYRSTLRRRIHLPVCLLLTYVLGHWLWNHYAHPPMEASPMAIPVTFQKVDRDLRLALAMESDPGWLRLLAGAPTVDEALNSGMKAMDRLHGENLRSPMLERARQTLAAGTTAAKDYQRKSLRNLEADWFYRWMVVSNLYHPDQRAANQQSFGLLRTRAIAANGTVWCLGLVGLVCVPRFLRAARSLSTRTKRSYVQAWPLSLGWTIFLVSILAWIGFLSVVQLGLRLLPSVHPLLFLALDTVARLLPALLCIALLFHQPRHALSRFGIHKPLHLQAALGAYGLLFAIDFLLSASLPPAAPELYPLNPAESGPCGLATIIISICMITPITEEIVHRGVLFQSMRNSWGIPIAALASSLIFSLLHFYEGYGLASLVLFGVFTCVLFAATRSLLPAILLHVIYNASLKIPEWAVYHSPL